MLVNPRRDLGASSLAGGSAPRDPRSFHRRWPGYAPTPLHSAPARAARLGLGSLRIKDESLRLGLPAFKILGASWATYRLLVERLGAEPEWSDVATLRAALAPLGPLTLATATDGNHGRAVAHVAHRLGYRAEILVPAGTAAARIDAIRAEGAAVTVVDGTYDDAVVRAAALARTDVLVVSDTAWDGYTQVPTWVIEGYETIFAEVDEQVDEQIDGPAPDLVVVQMGVGALAAAAVRHYAARAALVIVEPLDAACGLASAAAGHPVAVPGPHRSIMAGLNCGAVSPVAWPAVAAGADAFVAIDDRTAVAALRDLAGLGIVAGETGASGWAGLHALAALDPPPVPVAGRHALVLCTEGATDPVAYARLVAAEGRVTAAGTAPPLR